MEVNLLMMRHRTSTLVYASIQDHVEMCKPGDKLIEILLIVASARDGAPDKSVCVRREALFPCCLRVFISLLSICIQCKSQCKQEDGFHSL